MHIMAKLVDQKGRILIPGINELVAPVTEEEKKLYPNISYTMENLFESIGSKTSIFETKDETLMARWRFPSLSLHGVEGAFYQPGAKTVLRADRALVRTDGKRVVKSLRQRSGTPDDGDEGRSPGDRACGGAAHGHATTMRLAMLSAKSSDGVNPVSKLLASF